jgi:hypothetical protein
LSRRPEMGVFGLKMRFGLYFVLLIQLIFKKRELFHRGLPTRPNDLARIAR